jgi:hypothetical protein
MLTLSVPPSLAISMLTLTVSPLQAIPTFQSIPKHCLLAHLMPPPQAFTNLATHKCSYPYTYHAAQCWTKIKLFILTKIKLFKVLTHYISGMILKLGLKGHNVSTWPFEFEIKGPKDQFLNIIMGIELFQKLPLYYGTLCHPIPYTISRQFEVLQINPENILL